MRGMDGARRTKASTWTVFNGTSLIESAMVAAKTSLSVLGAAVWLELD